MALANIMQNLLAFLEASPSPWHAVASCKERLDQHHFLELKENRRWDIQAKTGYYITRNGSSICAFITPHKKPVAARILAAHTDSPGLKLKPNPQIFKQQMLSLGVEIYGAPLLTSWLNRDLGIAGKVAYYNKKNKIEECLVRLDQFPCIIPQLAIHLDREVNDKGLTLNKQEHLNALASIEFDSKGLVLENLLKSSLALKELIHCELFFYPLEKGRLIGLKQELAASYRMDNLASVHAALFAFLNPARPLQDEIKMIIFWDHEEIGSQTSQGAASPFLEQCLKRILLSFNLDEEDYYCCLNQSLTLSLDVAHALHPNHMDKQDAQHPILLGKGVVLKEDVNKRYISDPRSSASLHSIAKRLGLNLQRYSSRNDMLSGKTIGPIHASATGMATVDIGIPQLSMHSCREIISCQDHIDMCHLLKAIINNQERLLL